MDDTKGSIKGKLNPVTSPTKASRQPLSQAENTPDGVKLPTDEKAEIIRDLLSRLLDVTNSWKTKLDVTIPAPFISSEYIFFAFPLVGHVTENSVTSSGGQNFIVDKLPVIPVTSEDE
jgi:hypothetical protein